MVQTLAQVLLPNLNNSFAFFGHSLGAFIGFELIRLLCEQNSPSPVHLFVSGQRARQIPDPDPLIYQLPNHQFMEEIRFRYNGIPQAVLQNAELMKILLSTVRADFTTNDTYA